MIIRPLKDRKITLILLLFVLLPCLSTIQMSEARAETLNTGVRVTVLEGRASLAEKDMTEMRLLATGDCLAAGDCVRTGKNSRIEFSLPDESLIRFDELTTFKLSLIDFDKKTGQRRINIHLMTGKGWFNVSGTVGRLEILTPTTSLNAHYTVFRVDVDNDETVVVKVYRGKVDGSGFSKPGEVSSVEKKAGRSEGIDPDPVSPAASEKNWTHSIEAMRQMVVHPGGIATKPFRFSAKADMNPWVRWNRQLDQGL
jgi:ferric-dicitrate binding protein FerR (iron transport regulator)